MNDACEIDEITVLELDAVARATGTGPGDTTQLAWLLPPSLGGATAVEIPGGTAPDRIRLRYRAPGEAHVREWELTGTSQIGAPLYRLVGDTATSFPGRPLRAAART